LCPFNCSFLPLHHPPCEHAFCLASFYLICMSMSSYDNWLLPRSNQSRNIAANNCFAKYSSSKNVSKQKMPNLPHNKNIQISQINLHSLIGDTSYHIQNELNDYFLKKLSTKLKLRIIHQPFTISNLLKYKDKQELLHCAGVLYQLTCSCGRKYQFNRNLSYRQHRVFITRS